jgi:hypothetical protein
MWQVQCILSHFFHIQKVLALKVPIFFTFLLKLQSVHFQNFLSIISAPNRSFKTKIRWQDVRCKKEKHRKKNFLFMENIIYLLQHISTPNLLSASWLPLPSLSLLEPPLLHFLVLVQL